jgi:P-type Ca2+ transporter type 2C
VVYAPPLQKIFHTESLSFTELAVCLIVSSLVFFVVEIEKFVKRMMWGQKESAEDRN